VILYLIGILQGGNFSQAQQKDVDNFPTFFMTALFF